MSKPDTIARHLIREMNKNKDVPVAFSLTEPNPTDVKEFISTGSSVLDYLIANRPNGGVPSGKLTEIVGEEATGKSLMCAHIMANVQKKDGIAIYLDTENAANAEFMKRVGVDIGKLVYLQPGTMEESYEAIEKTIMMANEKAAGRPVCVIWDSTAATPPKAEIEGDYDPNSRMGLAAKAHAKGMRKLTQLVGRDNVTLIFTNHLKYKIGVIYGDPYMIPGGKAVPYHASVRIRLTRSKEQKNEQTKEVYGVNTIAKVFKNRLGPPMRSCRFNIMFADGIDDVNSIRDTLHERGFIKKGAWCRFEALLGETTFRWDDWAQVVKDNREKLDKVMSDILVAKYDQAGPLIPPDYDPDMGGSLTDDETGEVA